MLRHSGSELRASNRSRVSTRVCYAGTFERNYPRNLLVIQALRDAGARVEVSHVPIFERQRDKSRMRIRAAIGLGVRLLVAYLYLVPDVALRLLRCRIIVFGYIGQIDVLVLGPVARLMGRTIVFNPLVTLTDTIVEDRAVVKAGSIAARLIGLIDRLALRLADIIVVDTEQNGRYLQQTFGVPEWKLIVMPVGADEAVFHPKPSENTNHSSGLRVIFYGKFIPLHGIGTVIRAAHAVQQSDDGIQFEIIGRGQDYAVARHLASRLGVTNIEWVDWVSFDELGDRLRRSDIALGIFGTGGKAGRVVPNKVHQSLAAGVATITRDSEAVRDLLDVPEHSLLVPAGDADALARAILDLRDSSCRGELARAGHIAWSRKASRAALAVTAREVLRRAAQAQ